MIAVMDSLSPTLPQLGEGKRGYNPPPTGGGEKGGALGAG